jgi:hypothetical protein
MTGHSKHACFPSLIEFECTGSISSLIICTLQRLFPGNLFTQAVTSLYMDNLSDTDTLPSAVAAFGSRLTTLSVCSFEPCPFKGGISTIRKLVLHDFDHEEHYHHLLTCDMHNLEILCFEDGCDLSAFKEIGKVAPNLTQLDIHYLTDDLKSLPVLPKLTSLGIFTYNIIPTLIASIARLYPNLKELGCPLISTSDTASIHLLVETYGNTLVKLDVRSLLSNWCKGIRFLLSKLVRLEEIVVGDGQHHTVTYKDIRHMVEEQNTCNRRCGRPRITITVSPFVYTAIPVEKDVTTYCLLDT